MKNKNTFPLFVLVIALSLVLSACQGVAQTPETHDTSAVGEQQVEKEVMNPNPERRQR